MASLSTPKISLDTMFPTIEADTISAPTAAPMPACSAYPGKCWPKPVIHAHSRANRMEMGKAGDKNPLLPAFFFSDSPLSTASS